MRLLDIIISAFALLTLWWLLLLVFILCIFDTGSPIFIQNRMGLNKTSFRLFKFRTMKVCTEDLPSHDVDSSVITKIGMILRKTKLDELPQLYNVLKGDMSIVGPRPNLLNQYELIQQRDKFQIYSAKPGITGLAQIQNIDMSQPKLLAKTDFAMLQTLTIGKYLKYNYWTLRGRGQGDAAKY